MKGGREVGKVMGPLFPRLHVNDADKGGPRAPPRNKMALYEQFSIPSKRHNHVFIPPSSGSSMVPSLINIQEQTTSFQNKLPPQSPLSKQSQMSSMKGQEHGSLRISCSSSSDNFSKVKICQKKTDDGEDCCVPTLKKDQIGTKKQLHDTYMNRDTITSSSQLKHHPLSCEKFTGGTSITGSKIKIHDRNVKHTLQESSKIKNTCLLGSEERNADSAVIFNVASNEKIIAVAEKSEIGGVMSVRGSIDHDQLHASNCNPVVSYKNVASGVRSGPHSVIADTDKHPDHLVGNWKDTEVVKTQKIGELANNDFDSGSSLVDSEAGFNISPDDMYRVIGPKNYWKTRQVLRNQQRVFLEQVFELHRLIKVQKYIAASPSLLLQGNSCLPQTLEVSNEIPSSNPKPVLQWQRQIPDKDDPHMDRKDGHKIGPTAEATPDICSRGGKENEDCRMAHCTRDSSAITTAAESRHPVPWCFPPPGNQWLIPVMSPSEGLVYKPCLPPNTNLGFMQPAFGGCNSMPMIPFPGGAFSVPMPSHQSNAFLFANYLIPPNGVPVANHGMLPILEQTMTPAGVPPQEQFGKHYHGSANTLNPERFALSENNQKHQVLRNLELQGNTSMEQGDLEDQASCTVILTPPQHSAEHRQVIRVVPHNPRIASESAARIFQSIQKERHMNGLE